jgi:tetratricopeptide (TPR) repeat protein
MTSRNNRRRNRLQVDEIINRAGMMMLEYEEDKILISINSLKEVLSRSSLTEEQKQKGKMTLAQAYQHRGEHINALEILKSLTENHILSQISVCVIKYLSAISYVALSDYDMACDIYDEIFKLDNTLTFDPEIWAGIELEAGKAYRGKGDNVVDPKNWTVPLGVG